jgi:hypothetical protein
MKQGFKQPVAPGVDDRHGRILRGNKYFWTETVDYSFFYPSPQALMTRKWPFYEVWQSDSRSRQG